MITIFGTISILLTEISKWKKLPPFINVILRLTLATLRLINLKRKAQPGSVSISQEEHVLKVLIASFITECHKMRT